MASALPTGTAWRPPLAVVLVSAVSLLAWAALAAWSASPFARLLDHGRWSDLPLLGAVCGVLPQGEWLAGLAFHGGAWLLMIAAMMLPTVLPLVSVVARIAAARADGGPVVALLVLGYAAAWSAFGALAFGVDAALRSAAAQSAWLAAHGTWVGAAVLATAGAFQFSALKYRCLDRCRTPFSFVATRWTGRRPLGDGFRIGLDHGAFCVGCCWALMLVMFVVGMTNLGWMLLLGGLMAIEKNLSFGRRLAGPIGLGLFAAAAVLALRLF